MVKESREESLEFKDSYLKNDLKFKVVPIENLTVISHQRKSSVYHIKHLIKSIERIGFIVPLVVVEKDDECIIIDGQHRFLAAKELGIRELPVIIVPEKLAQLMMNLNTEKELNIREKSYIALAIYRQYLKFNSEILESDPLIVDSIEEILRVTLGIGYEIEERLTGGSFESILKKCDFFLDEKLKDAFEIRKKRAIIVVQVNNLIKEISQKLKEIDKWHPYIFQQIISYANPYKRKKLPTEFDDLFNAIIENLEKVKKNPTIILKEELEEF